MELEHQLLCDGELMLARILRRKLLEKVEVRKMILTASHNIKPLTSLHLTSKLVHCLEAEIFGEKNWHFFDRAQLLDPDLIT